VTINPLIAIKNKWRTHSRKPENERNELTLKKLPIGLAASYTIDNLLPFVGGFLVDYGFDPQFHIAPYNQIFQVCLSHQTYFPENCDVVVVLWRLEDLMGDEAAEFLGGHKGALKRKNRQSCCGYRSAEKKFFWHTDRRHPTFPRSHRKRIESVGYSNRHRRLPSLHSGP
jgi:hypothetical protein